MPAPRRILDVGCGTGYLLGRLAACAPQAEVLAGIDAAPAMIEVARAAAADGRLRFVTGEVNGYDAIETGLILIPGTIGILVASAGADRFARRHPQRWLIIAGFLVTAIGMALLLVLVRAHSGVWTWISGLFLFGAGIGSC